MNVFDLTGKHVLVTGGSRGIGFGIAKALATAGASVTLLSRDQAKLETAASEIRAAGAKANLYSFDMGDAGQIPHAFAAIVEKFGPVETLVNNAGAVKRELAEKLTLEDFRKVLEINLTGVFAMAQAFALHRMALAQPGKIINIASLMSEHARKFTTAYASSKGGVKMLTKALAVEWAPHHINVNAIGPGFIKTDFTQPLWTNPEFDGWVRQRTPQARWGEAGDIGNVAVFLASSASDFVTGQVIYVDGGLLATL